MLVKVVRDFRDTIEGFDAVELRVDCGNIREYIRNSPIPVILKGDRFDLEPQFVDLDHDTDKAIIQKRHEQYPNVKIILSYHNFEKTPDNLLEIFTAMQSPYVDLYKLACQPHSFLDVLRMLEFQDEDVVAISMGEMGQITRLCSSVGYVSDPLVYGQLSLADLKKKDVYALIGYPVAQSIGHIFHNELMSSHNLDAIYLKFPLHPEELTPFFAKIHRMRIKGLSVTMPLKEKVLPYLDVIDPDALAIGAVNTICVNEGKLIGYNTDGIGALDVLGSVGGKKVVILGTGGAAKAIHYVLCQNGANVFMLRRSEFGYVPIYDILINCTPNSMPIDPQYILPGSTVMDIQIGHSQLLAAASKKGCTIITGNEMFLKQAAYQAELFYFTIP